MPLIVSVIVLFLAPLIWNTVEPAWSLLFTSALLTASGVQIAKNRGISYSPATAAFAGFAGLSAISLVFHWLILNRAQPVYLDNMLKALLFVLSELAIFYLASVNKDRVSIYAQIIAILAGNCAAASRALNDYLPHLKHGEAVWREFGNMTDPDFFAGQLVMVLPLIVAMFVGAKTEKHRRFRLLYILCAVLIFAAIPITGSRFAIVSTVAGIIILAAAMALGVRNKLVFTKGIQSRIAVLFAVLLLIGAIVAKPIGSRLSGGAMKAQAHSGNFRLWTWKGALLLIKAEPVLGAGPGQFVYAYPKRAITGYTTHAHCAYLQTACNSGVPALLLFIAGATLLFLSGIRGLKINLTDFSAEPPVFKRRGKHVQVDEIKENEFLGEVALLDDRYLIIGLLAAVSAALVQNLIDSDWFNYETGITLFALFGLIAAVTPAREKKMTSAMGTWSAVTVIMAAAIYGGVVSIAQFDEQAGNYLAAVQLNPLDSQYNSVAAIQISFPQGDIQQAEKYLVSSAKLAPDPVAYHRLGMFYQYSIKDSQKALSSYKSGLVYDPKSITCLLSAAELSQTLGQSDKALGYYQRIAALELSPDGTVRAIPEVSETRFADADDAIGDAYMAREMPGSAIAYYIRAKDDCEDYRDEGGSHSLMRMAMSNFDNNTDLDSHMRALYTGVLNNLVRAYDQDHNPEASSGLRAQFNALLQRFPGS